MGGFFITQALHGPLPACYTVEKTEWGTDMKKPIIGVMGNLLLQQDAAFVHMERVYANTAYLRAIERGGGIPLLLSIGGDAEDTAQALSHCDGLLLPGGLDITPELYGEEPHAALGAVLPEQDAAWAMALREATRLGLPVLGICRGMQFLCVFSGGSLYQDLSAREEPSLQHLQQLRRTHPIHSVVLTPGSVLAGILGTESVRVNSLHHQAVKEPGEGLRVCARAKDGIVEAVESADGLWLGVQWHPEELLDTVPRMNLLFEHFVEEAQKRSKLDRAP